MLDMAQRMFFVIGAPRSGTTLLMRMLNAHPDIYTRPEPHLLTPLAHLGYYAHVDKASYDPYQAAMSAKQYVADLPNGEADYLEALRAYSDTLYGKMLEPSGKRYFVEKTPAYALVLPFIAKLYPQAKYVVLTRHPFAIFSSFAKSFFDDDWEAAHEHNPILERYVPAMARFIREAPVEHVHVSYEALVSDPEAHLQRICAHAEMPFDAGMVEYGNTKLEVEGLGDPIGVNADTRPNTASLDKWALGVKGNAKRIDLLKRSIDRIFDEDLETFGYTRETLWNALETVDADAAKKAQRAAKQWDRYHVERRVLVNLRKGIHGNVLGQAVQAARFYSDILLRDTWSDQIDPEITKPATDADSEGTP
ncbi:MAG: sulfotransferase [Alphaproteobacteria bacterium]|nr:sulfotransferase [Alphaproteobacteria bacterium]